MVRPVNGEDYSHVSMDPEQPMVVEDSAGNVVTFDPHGKTTTPLEYPEAVVVAQQEVGRMAATLGPSIQKAIEAYRVAHQGAQPSDDAGVEAILPYFESVKTAADVVEYDRAMRYLNFVDPTIFDLSTGAHLPPGLSNSPP
jgi:hypothetical protein